MSISATTNEKHRIEKIINSSDGTTNDLKSQFPDAVFVNDYEKLLAEKLILSVNLIAVSISTPLL